MFKRIWKNYKFPFILLISIIIGSIIGVIFGEDISYNPVTKKIEYHLDKFIDTNSISKDPNKTIGNIINAYKVLLTRGVYGTYIYAVDKNLRDYIKSLIK